MTTAHYEHHGIIPYDLYAATCGCANGVRLGRWDPATIPESNEWAVYLQPLRAYKAYVSALILYNASGCGPRAERHEVFKVAGADLNLDALHPGTIEQRPNGAWARNDGFDDYRTWIGCAIDDAIKMYEGRM